MIGKKHSAINQGKQPNEQKIKRIGQAAGALLLGLWMSASVITGEDAQKAAPVQTLITIWVNATQAGDVTGSNTWSKRVLLCSALTTNKSVGKYPPITISDRNTPL